MTDQPRSTEPGDGEAPHLGSGDLADTATEVEELVAPPEPLSPPEPRSRPRRSTLVIAACFAVVLGLYLWVRPDPPPRGAAPEVGRVVQDAETGEIFVLPTTTAPPETTTTTAPTTSTESSTTTSTEPSTTTTEASTTTTERSTSTTSSSTSVTTTTTNPTSGATSTTGSATTSTTTAG